MLGYYVHDLSPFIIQFNDVVGLRWYGLSYVAAFIIGIYLIRYLARQGYCDIPEEKVSDFVVGGAIFGVLIGGRLGYMLFYDLGQFLRDPLTIIRVWDGGMSAHGGMLGITLYIFWYAWRHKVSWLNVADSLAVAAPIGLMLGRFANFINGELFGRVTNVAWAVQFPKELWTAPPETVQLALNEAAAINPAWTSIDAIIDNSRHSPELRHALAGILSPRHPSQIYEALLEGALLFTLLWIVRTRFRVANGVISGLFLLGYAILRSVVECFREPDAPLTGALTRGQFLSIFLVLLSLAFFISAWRKPSYPARFRS